VLTGGSTCSASEAIINSLQGVNVQVIQIGSTTCGKPYGFYPADNCAVTYFSIQFQGVNAKNFGDYPDGFTPQNTVATEGVLVPGCSVADDFTHTLGDPAEGRLGAELRRNRCLSRATERRQRRRNQACLAQQPPLPPRFCALTRHRFCCRAAAA
jgi:hypothetical protein